MYVSVCVYVYVRVYVYVYVYVYVRVYIVCRWVGGKREYERADSDTIIIFCHAMQWSAVQCHAMQLITMQYSVMQFNYSIQLRG